MLKNKSWIVWISSTTVDLPGNGCGNDLYYKVPVQVINSGINPIVYILVFEMYRSCVVYFNDKELKKSFSSLILLYFLQQSASTSPLYVPFNVLEYYVLVDEVHQ